MLQRARNVLLQVARVKSASEKSVSFWTSVKRDAGHFYKGATNQKRLPKSDMFMKLFQLRQFSSSTFITEKTSGPNALGDVIPVITAEPEPPFMYKLPETWTNTDVVQWAHDELNFADEVIKILVDKHFVGKSLFLVQNLDKLINVYGFPHAAAELLWSAIQKLPRDEPYKHVYLPQLIKEWQSLSRPSIKYTVGQFGSEMPVEQRDEQVELVWNSFVQHYRAWKIEDMDRKSHERCFAYGPPGSGKTKFGGELIQLLKDHGNQLVHKQTATKEEEEFLGLLHGAVFIHISFANGLGLFGNEMSTVDTPLVLRGIKNLFGLQEDLLGLTTRYGRKINDWNLNTLLDIAIKYGKTGVSDTTKPTMVYIHLDEFNHLCDQSSTFFKKVVDALSTPLNNSRRDLLYTVLFTGTAYKEMRELGVSESNPLVEIPMKALSTEGITNVVSTMYAKGHLKWLDPNWENNTPFMLSILNTGGLPRALEYVLEAIEKRADLEQQTLNSLSIDKFEDARIRAESELTERYQKAWNMVQIDIYIRVLTDSILGTPIDLDDNTVPVLQNYATLLKFGNIVLKKSNNKWRIQLPSLWLNQYSEKFPQFMPPQLQKELVSIQPETWSKWERVTATMVMLRTNAFKLKEATTFTLRDIFPDPKLADSSLLDWQFTTYDKFYQRRTSTYQFLHNRTATKKGLISVLNPLECGNVWINGERGPCLDVWTVYKNAGADTPYTIVFVQNKFTAKNSSLYTKTVIDTYQALENLWKTTQPSVKLNDYRFLLAVVSNCQLKHNHSAEDEKKRREKEVAKQEKAEKEQQEKSEQVLTDTTAKKTKKPKNVVLLSNNEAKRIEAHNNQVLSKCIHNRKKISLH